MGDLQNNHGRDEEEFIRVLLRKSRMEAPGNLSHRIMRQVENNRALTPKKIHPGRSGSNVVADFKTIFGIMYIAILAVGAGFYFSSGGESLKSGSFLSVAIGLASLFSLFWLVVRLDTYLREKIQRKHGGDKS